MAKEIKFNIKLLIDGKEQLVTASTSAKELRDNLDAAKSSAAKFREKMITVNQTVAALQNASSAINGLRDTMAGLTASYNAVQQANTQLTTVMRQRMNATEEDIKKVNEVIGAQSKLGVIGGTIQKTGAQQIATFLKEKGTLELLIPSMNDLLAQQKGLNATQEDARSVANLMGKAMTGQTSALRRVGITFSEAQENIMKYGTEQQRAAMLAQIITDNVGHMNAQLGKTDAGQLKQAEMQFAAIKVQIGELVSKWLPKITFAAQALTIVNSMILLGNSIKGATMVIAKFGITTKAVNAVCIGFRASVVGLTAVTRVMQAAFTGATIGATTLKVAIRGLMIASGVGIAIVALTEVISAFSSKSSEAKDKADEQTEAMKEMNSAADEVKNAYDSTLKSTYSELMSKYDKLKEGWKSLSTEQQKVQWIKQNQSAFDELRLKIDSVSEAENIFNNKTDAVVEAFKQRAMAAAYAAKLTALYQKQIDLLDKKKKVTKSISDDAKNSGRNAKEGDIVPENWRNERYGKVGNDGEWRFTKIGAERYNGTNVSGNKQIYSIDKSLNAVNQEITDTQKQLAEKLEASKGFITADKPAKPVRDTTNTANTPSAVEPKTYIEKLQAQLSAAQKTKDNALTIEARVEADAKVKKIQAQIDEATKGKVTIEAATEPTYIVAGSAADKRKSYSNAQQRIGNIRQDYDSGLIDKASAQKAIADINDQLSALGLKPIEVHFKTPIEELQEQLQNAQRSLDEATTIEAKVKASAKIAEIQAEIDRATKGNVSIAAEVEPEYIEQGSAADKRQSYSNAQQKTSRIQNDYEIGIIGKDEAMKQIDEVNKELADLGLKPIKITLEPSGFDKAFEQIQKGWGSVQNISGGIQGISDALEGNGNAWEKTSAMINGFISIAQGIQGIVELYNLLSVATTAHAAATAADTTATTVNTGVTAANTAASTVNTVAKEGEAIANATASGAKMPFPANLIAIAAGVAAVVAAIAAMSSFATGGVVGGTSTFGDRKFARVNSGEMILNKTQQAHLFQMINTPRYTPPSFARRELPQMTPTQVTPTQMNDVHLVERHMFLDAGFLRPSIQIVIDDRAVSELEHIVLATIITTIGEPSQSVRRQRYIHRFFRLLLYYFYLILALSYLGNMFPFEPRHVDIAQTREATEQKSSLYTYIVALSLSHSFYLVERKILLLLCPTLRLLGLRQFVKRIRGNNLVAHCLIH